MEQVKKISVANSIRNEITPETAKRLGDGKVVPIQRPKPKFKKVKK